MTKTEAWTRPRGHRRLGAAALAALFLTTCTAPHRTGREPAPRSTPAAPRETVIDEGPVRLEVLDEGHWRLVVVQPPYAPASLTLSADEIWPASRAPVLFQHAAFFDGHHIATRENSKSAQRGGPWTPQFEEVFERAKLSLDDPANLVNLNGHYGPRPEAYHSMVYRRLLAALGTCAEPGTCRPLLVAELKDIASEICTPGSMLNRLITRQ